MIKVLIVDDEALARKRIRTLLEQDEQVRVCHECSNGAEAIAAINDISPDLLSLMFKCQN
ncbi:MAG: two-component response-regulatory protein YehT [Acidobacteriales bacterium]|nr:two-component response-regulatory protein YehT [Terriglobales bacterium]